METIFIEKLEKLSSLPEKQIGENENNVKYKFIIPFLECFGYSADLDFEHSAQGMRIDIFIDNISTHKIVVEAKRYGKIIDEAAILQLKEYCDKKRPILAIISNGKEIRFYSPLWRISDFSDTLLYSFQREELKNENVFKRIEKIFSKENLENKNIEKFILERETEIKKAKGEIKSIQNIHKDKFAAIENEISKLNQKIKTLEGNVNKKQQEILELEISKKNKIESLCNELLIKINNNTKEKSPLMKLKDNDKNDNISELPKYVKQRIPSINNPGTIPFEMLNLIKQKDGITWNDIEKTMIEKFGYTENSGSISGSYSTLLWLGLIRIEGKKNRGKIFFVKDYQGD